MPGFSVRLRGTVVGSVGPLLFDAWADSDNSDDIAESEWQVHNVLSYMRLYLHDNVADEEARTFKYPPYLQEEFVMDGITDSVPSKRATRNNRRRRNEKRNKTSLEFLGAAKLEDIELVETPMRWPQVNMKDVDGTEYWIGAAQDIYYANMHYLDPKKDCPPNIMSTFGKDMAPNAQGIYYWDSFDKARVPTDQNLFIPSFKNIDWDSPAEADRRGRARVVGTHMVNNETCCKSEFAWEADAWSDIFGCMRNDNQLAIDKRECNAVITKTDPTTCMLSGETTFVRKIPDVTFGLTTYAPKSICGQPAHTACDNKHCAALFPTWNSNLQRDHLERLMLYNKCGLLPDPKWGETDLAFPFMVYEAKGWNGDSREARRQACLAATTYLDMLDNLSREPGTVGTSRPFQTKKSHENQVFALTSFGAQWHVLVAFKRLREKEEHSEMEDCVSRDVYIFQKIWSGRVINERSAWELLSLIDQIHEYAVTTFRKYVIEHLHRWHIFLYNSLLNQDLKCDIFTKTMNGYTSIDPKGLPSWTKSLSTKAKAKLRLRAKESLATLLDTQREHKKWEVNLPPSRWPRVGVSKPYTPDVGLAPASSKLGVRVGPAQTLSGSLGSTRQIAAEKGHADDVVIVYSRELNCLHSTPSFSTVYFNQLYSVRRHLNFDIKEQWRQPS
ncbi:hypothetical protein V501_03895 [Pseudogymnoascus sp. VKM F-4519 (FW-2642)]|nr:hypothetical protein V501_03895 [Pseudogymnoascus sp. VKM F-4519 (FW-2642)]